jgi:hypothetical protein
VRQIWLLPRPSASHERSKQPVRPMLILPSKSCVEVINPGMCELNGMFDAFKTHCAHDSLQDKHDTQVD